MMLAFSPLFDPLPALYPWMSDYWLVLVVPLVIAISLVYKGTRVAELRKLPMQVLLLTTQILLLMVVAAVALDGLYWVWLRAL
jgi:hypothetical protein